MSDSEATAAAEGAEEAQEEFQDARETPDSSPPTTPDISTDVAPTRKARRRPEPKPAAEVEEKPKTPSDSTVSQGGWGYWGSWGKSILSTATATVATVGQGLTQVIEKAETSLGIPSPTELSAQVEEEQKEQGEASSQTDKAAGEGSVAMGSAMGMLTSLTSVVQSTGKTVITGGLDALEFIGKKTMDVIAEGDPGFKKTKGLINRNSTLSQVLREAKEREELQQTAEKESDSEKKAVKSVLTTLSGDELVRLREELELIKESFSLVEFDDEEVDEKKDEDGSEFEKEMTEALEGLSITATAEKLSKACKSTCSQITDMTKPQEEEGEEDVKKALSVESNEKGDVLNPLITGVFLEASNSASYIQDAFQLLMPILEISHIQRRAESTEQ
ncbi:hypothetical protein GBF38_019582 [Nibea albiflora]|uniref:Uncharacterized protein n=1 Tax=Nibea albiflora TaxID=240163 RepID=A0ACB7F2S8_NIBAL|nr:hypothetical protein GBF38_019582 [Nibea albiflora]